MKGTLFSADFIKDNDGNHRLLELNTDTGITSASLSQIDYTDLFTELSSQNITEVHVIYKSLSENLVNHFSQSVSENAPFITTFNTTLEESTTIYPTNVEDSDDKFIFRFAYDESAIFDSTYCKNAYEPLKLFVDNSNSDSVVPFYYSSSVDGITNTLLTSLNSENNIPDFTSKLTTNPNAPKNLIKLGGDGTVEDKINNFIANTEENTLIENFFNDNTETYSKSVRSLNVIYGTNLDIINLGTYESVSMLEKPDIMSFDSSSDIGIVDIKHRYEFTTNYVPTYFGGIFEEENILDVDGNGVPVSNLVIGNTYKSYYVEGTPDSDLPTVFEQFKHDGHELPSGSFETSSVLINYVSQSLKNNLVNHVVMEDGSDFRAVGGQHLLVYDSVNDYLTYESLGMVDPERHKFLTLTGETASIDVNEVEVLDGDYKHYILDMEETDTYLLENGGLNVKIVTHNCFPAGTQVRLPDGSSKNIEELKPGDVILSFDEESKELFDGIIGDIRKTTHQGLINIYADYETDIRTTPLHKFYVDGKGYITANQIQVGDKLLNSGGEYLEVLEINNVEGEFEVYHIMDVQDRHNYFVEDVLVHNIKFGVCCFSEHTDITLSNGDVKSIVDIEIGDEVMSWNGEELVPSRVIGVDDKWTVGSHAEACESLGDEPSLYTINDTGIEFTPEHPFLTKNGWKALVPYETQEPFLSQQQSQKLEVGDEILINGEWEEIQDIRVVRSNPDEKVYNFTVENYHSYVANGIVVHNK